MSVSELEQEKSKEKRQAKRINTIEALRWFATKILVPILILLILWQLIANLNRITLLDVFNAFWELVTVGDSSHLFLIDHISASVGRVILGFVLAAATAVPLGVIIGRYRLADAILGPVVEAMRPIPPIAWIPISLLMFANNIIGAQAFIIWIGAFFPILLNTITGVKRTEAVHIDAAKTLGANERQILGKIVIPSASPEIFTGLRIGFGIGWMCLVAAEMLRPAVGLGSLIWVSWALGRTGRVITGMLFIGLIGFLFTLGFLIIERYLLRWRQSVSV